MTPPLGITDEDRKAADRLSGLDIMEMGNPAERIAHAMSYGFIKGAEYGKTQCALEVIKMLESYEARDLLRAPVGLWLRERLGIGCSI